jgi:chemotaxis protein CheC
MPLTDAQCDAMRELGNIGAAHAATTLSLMLGTEVGMTVPEIHMVDLSEVHRHIGDEISALVLFQIQGELSCGGYLLLHVPKASAIRLTNTMLGYTDLDRPFDEMDRSALLEIGNIMVSSFLDATAGLLNIVMLPSPPQLAFDMPHAAIQTILAQQMLDIDEVVLFCTELRSETLQINSNLMLLPNPPMLTDIITILEDLVKPSA